MLILKRNPDAKYSESYNVLFEGRYVGRIYKAISHDPRRTPAQRLTFFARLRPAIPCGTEGLFCGFQSRDVAVLRPIAALALKEVEAPEPRAWGSADNLRNTSKQQAQRLCLSTLQR